MWHQGLNTTWDSITKEANSNFCFKILYVFFFSLLIFRPKVLWWKMEVVWTSIHSGGWYKLFARRLICMVPKGYGGVTQQIFVRYSVCMFSTLQLWLFCFCIFSKYIVQDWIGLVFFFHLPTTNSTTLTTKNTKRSLLALSHSPGYTFTLHQYWSHYTGYQSNLILLSNFCCLSFMVLLLSSRMRRFARHPARWG